MYRGQTTTVRWSHDSFPHARGFFDHDVTPSTRIVELVVGLPNGSRRFANATLEERVAGEPGRILDAPSAERNGTILRAKIRSPLSGRTIRFGWDW
jgi:hypothetical protein